MDKDKIINKYVIEENNDGYVDGFYAVLEENFDYIGQMADFPEATEGWCKFVKGTAQELTKLSNDYDFYAANNWVESQEEVQSRLEVLIAQWTNEGKSEDEIAELAAQYNSQIKELQTQLVAVVSEIDTLSAKFNFVVDEDKKAEIIAEREAEAEKPTWQEQTDAQVVYTAMMTNTLLEE